MRVLVCSLSDSASVNIRNHLVDDSWQPVGEFRGKPVLRRRDASLIEIDGPAINDEALTAELEAWWPRPIRSVWFLSRHRAASGQPSLTVHPIGNHGEAKYGGQPETLSPAAARDMGALLRRLAVHREAHDLPHGVTYEATHHGPFMKQPSLFVEIGSNEDWYEDEPSGRALAAAVTDVLDGEGFLEHDAPIVVGVGGGHYVPQQTKKALEGEADFGHFLPSHGVDHESEDPSALLRCMAATPGAMAVYVHKKGLKGPQRQAVREWLEDADIASWHPSENV